MKEKPPRLFGRQFSRSEAGERYVLRVWLYSDNPEGLFAPANPAEACSAEGLVAWHAEVRECLEVFGLFPADAARLRALVPEEFELLKDPKDPTGNTAQLAIGGNHCASADIRDGPRAEPMLIAHYMVMLEPHDWAGVDPLGNRYMLGLIVNDRKVAGAVRKGMGVGPGVVRSSPDVARDFDPVAGSFHPAYRFTSPDYELRAAVVDPGFEDGGLGGARFWHKTPRGSEASHLARRRSPRPRRGGDHRDARHAGGGTPRLRHRPMSCDAGRRGAVRHLEVPAAPVRQGLGPRSLQGAEQLGSWKCSCWPRHKRGSSWQPDGGSR